MKSKWSLASATLGALVAFASGSGLFAITSDSVLSRGNSIESGTYAVPAHDLKVARSTVGPDGGETTVDCESGEYEDGPITGLVSTTSGPNYNISPPSTLHSLAFCLKNAGSQAGRLIVSLDNISDTEVGDCEPSEAAAEGGADTTCTDGAQGELEALLHFQLVRLEASSASCPEVVGDNFESVAADGLVAVPTLQSNEFCKFTLLVGPQPATTESQKLAAQTDRVQWDIVFTLQDVPVS